MTTVRALLAAAAPLAGGSALVASGATADGMINALSTFGGVGLLAAALWHMRQQDREDRKEERRQDREEWAKLASAITGMRDAIEYLRWSRRIQDDPGYRDRVTRHSEGMIEAARRLEAKGGPA